MAILQVLSSPTSGRAYELTKVQTVLGRYPFCDIVLKSSTVSRQHARIIRSGDDYEIEDTGSINGTFVNGERVQGRVRLKANDRIHLYDVLLVFHDNASLRGATQSDGETAPPPAVETSPAPADTIVHAIDVGTRRDISGDRLHAVMAITRDLGSTRDLERLLPRILDSLFEIFPQADRGHILLADGPAGDLAVRAVKQSRGESRIGDTFKPLSRELAAQVMSEAQAVLIADALESPADQSVLEQGARSRMCAPLIGSSKNPLGVIEVETDDADRPFRQEDLEVVASVAIAAGQAAELARERQARNLLERRQRELNIAREVQLRLLPRGRPKVEGYHFFDHYSAAEEVGGDFLGYVPLPDGRLAMAVGDVAGKGVSAALLMAQLATEVRYAVTTARSPADAMGILNESLANLENRFVTFILCVLDPRSHVLTVVNAGHPAPLWRRAATSAVEELGPLDRGLPLGVDTTATYQETVVHLDQGDLVMLYTDGVSEARNRDEAVFGSARICGALSAEPFVAQDAGPKLLGEIERFSQGRPQYDDVCVICFARLN